ncbi:hypothetical protein DMUE_0544 [Dictyocoela muelleri]|nr:hypothetical protein DMUE_0544 [Dictyocoela muelleri]
MYELFLVSMSIAFMMSLSACGSTTGIGLIGTSSVLYARNTNIVKYAYIGAIFSSTPIILSFILSIISSRKLETEIKFADATKLAIANVINGFSSYFSGIGMGSISKHSFRMINKNKNMGFYYIVMLISFEMTTIIGFIISMIIMN